MTKPSQLKPRQVVRALERAGFALRKSKGGHRTYVRAALRVTIPYHATDIKLGHSTLDH
jgi:predicted RNA binding protein YcfA (HicA-like mRNA interferase family)